MYRTPSRRDIENRLLIQREDSIQRLIEIEQRLKISKRQSDWDDSPSEDDKINRSRALARSTF
jgi:hypothetical protein